MTAKFNAKHLCVLISGSIHQINSELERDLMIRAVHDVKV